MEAAQPVGGEVLQPQLLPTGHWLPSLAQIIKLWTLSHSFYNVFHYVLIRKQTFRSQ